MQTQEGQLNQDELLLSYYNAYRLMQSYRGLETEEFEFLDDQVKVAFAVACRTLCDRLEALDDEAEGDGAAMSVIDLGRDLRATTLSQLDQPGSQSWEEVGLSERLLWEGLARHLINLMLADSQEDDISEFESGIVAWFEAELSKRQGELNETGS